MSQSEIFDYIVVGSGSAGAVVAARLSESGRFKVLLLEAGGKDRDPWIHVPAGFARLFMDKRVTWGDMSAPEPELGGRSIYYPYGKVLGGSSSVNGMVYIRGHREDFDHWEDLGNRGWSYRDVLPYFRKAESHQNGESEFHGGRGPIKVHEQFRRHELVDAYIAAAGQLGIPANEDFNAAQSEGAGYYQLTTDGWRRFSTAVGYLHPARKRPNLSVEVNARATRIVMQGRRATGVEFIQDGLSKSATAAREVIVAAGVINSPHLLQLSGIGPAKRLISAGIAVQHDLPGVGENAEDHYIAMPVYECTMPLSANDAMRTRWDKAKLVMNYAIRRTGWMTIGAAYGGGFFRTRLGSNRTDVQTYFCLFSSDDLRTPSDFSGISVGVFQSRPTSKGWVRTVSPDPSVRPEIRMNYLATQVDRDNLTAGLELIMRVMQAPAMAPFIERRVKPAADLSSSELLDWARENGAGAYHGVGTCRMGTDNLSVVDARLRVHGLSGLRVADGSIMPALVSGNTNASIIMIGEKAADMIIADASVTL
jgi:choline dehydrogenase